MFSRPSRLAARWRRSPKAFPKSLEIVGRSCWTFLVTTALNYLNLGLRAPPLEPVGNAWVNASPAQLEAVRYLKEQVSVFVELMPGTMPEVHWERALDARCSSYDGELPLKGLSVSWEQVAPTLPEPALCGCIPATRLASAHLQEWLEKPDLSIKPIEEWPRCFRRTAVRTKPGGWPRAVRTKP